MRIPTMEEIASKPPERLISYLLYSFVLVLCTNKFAHNESVLRGQLYKCHCWR